MTSDYDHLPRWMHRFYRTRYGRWNIRVFNAIADRIARICGWVR